MGLKSDTFTKLTKQDVVSGKDGIPSDSTSSLTSSGDATASVKGETDQESVAEQGVYYPPTSCYNYYYPGYNGALNQSDDHGYYNADGSYTGVQSDNGMVYYLPGYNPYASGTLMGVDGQCVSQPPYFSSGYLQQPVPYGTEAVPCYSWDSTYVGDAANGTNANFGNIKSGSRPTASAKANNFPSMKANGTVANKYSLPFDSKSRQSAAPSNFSKSIFQSQPLKPLNKASHLGSDFPAGFAKGFNPVSKFSSFTNQKQGFFPHNGVMNYRPNSRAWNGNEKYKLREKSNRNGHFESSTELTCGPRARNRNSPLNSATEKEELGLMVRRDQYNLQDFQTEYENAKFYVIKSFSEDDIHKCIKYDVWASTPNGNKKLDAAFHDAEAKANETGTKFPIFLFFSVNGSGQFVGVAEMVGQVDFNKDMDFWQLDKWNGFFPVKWHIVKDIPNSQLRHITLESNENRSVTYTRDTQEIGLKQGVEMLKIFKNYSARTSMFDDFNFYENREKSLHARRSSKPPPPSQMEIYGNGDDLPKHLHGEERKTEEPARTSRSHDPKSLINLTKNLSLSTPHPLKNSSGLNPTENPSSNSNSNSNSIPSVSG
ncbi:YTH domain-containing family protein 2 [Vitis vinifera]|uniref:YTH domain-containing family protein n=1 Tax=Vitis vinifera TaxID=29760 RepID=A0A438GUK1_VITVI|nr:YTH domain-containing family protein 2 [Vitis vinifera]